MSKSTATVPAVSGDAGKQATTYSIHLIAELAARNGIRIDPDHPAFRSRDIGSTRTGGEFPRKITGDVRAGIAGFEPSVQGLKHGPAKSSLSVSRKPRTSSPFNSSKRDESRGSDSVNPGPVQEFRRKPQAHSYIAIICAVANR